MRGLGEPILYIDEAGVRDIVLKPGTVAEMGQLIRERLDELHRARHVDRA